MPERWMTESPARTTRLKMSISISPSLITGMSGRSIPVARRLITMARASSSSGEKGSVRMSSTPRSNARSLVLRSPRRVRPRTGVPLRFIAFEAPSSLSSAVLSSWSMSTTVRCGRQSARIASASARVLAARTAKPPWFKVSVMRSTMSGRSWSTSARRGAPSRGFTWPSDMARPRCTWGGHVARARAADLPAPPHQPTAAPWRIRNNPNCGR